MAWFRRYQLRDENGWEIVEYTIMLALILAFMLSTIWLIGWNGK